MHDRNTEPQLDDDERQVLEYLRAHCVGRAAAQTQQRIADAVGLGRRRVHALFAQLVTGHGIAVCSAYTAPCGMFLASTIQELHQERQQLLNRFKQIAIRYSLLKQAAIMDGDHLQILLFDDELDDVVDQRCDWAAAQIAQVA